jgi:hypothetical protein
VARIVKKLPSYVNALHEFRVMAVVLQYGVNYGEVSAKGVPLVATTQ